MSFQRNLAFCAALLAAAGCATTTTQQAGGTDPHYKVGKPYQVNGRWYRPAEDPGYDKRGTASWYGDDFHGKRTANGEVFNMNKLTAAHTTLPLPSLVEVANLDNGKRTVVRVNDRGPFASNRIIDLSRAAARALGFEKQGLAHVRVRYLGPAPLPDSEGPRYAKASPQKALPAPSRATPAAAIVSTDNIAELISGADIDREPILPEPIAPQGYLIEVAVLSDPGLAPVIRERLAEAGPMNIQRLDNGAPAPQYSINLGPFAEESEAFSRLETVREAGYADAEIVPVRP